MMTGDAMLVAETRAEAEAEEADLTAHLEWMMPAGWLAVAAGLGLAACVAVGLLA